MQLIEIMGHIVCALITWSSSHQQLPLHTAVPFIPVHLLAVVDWRCMCLCVW